MHIVVQICCYNKCGIVLQGFNSHLLFGDHLLGLFFYFLYRNKIIFAFYVVYTIDESVQKNNLVFNLDLERVCYKALDV